MVWTMIRDSRIISFLGDALKLFYRYQPSKYWNGGEVLYTVRKNCR